MNTFISIFLFSIITSASSVSTINLESIKQPDKITREDFTSFKYCARECKENEPPRTCYYNWTAENYVTMGPSCGKCPQSTSDCDNEQCVVGNGFEKAIMTINRMVPGPSIEVCRGDRVIVDITNLIAGNELTIHWHGLWQIGTPYMDGVPMVTQCPIHEGQTFRYDFLANNSGSHYWHSHDGFQKLNGIQGNFVVRETKQRDPNGALYDTDLPEHTLMVTDWVNTTAESRFPGLHDSLPGELPNSILLQGKGHNKIYERTGLRFPYKEIVVQQSRKHLLRLVGGLCTVCGVEFSVENHNLTVVATDGASIKPIQVNSIIIYSGERYDIILEADKDPGTYWIHMRGLQECENAEVYQLALLRYEGTDLPPSYPSPTYDGNLVDDRMILNPENATCRDTGVCMIDLHDISEEEQHRMILSRPPHFSFPLAFGFKIFNSSQLFKKDRRRYFVAPDRTLLTSAINNISFTASSSPLLTQEGETELCPVGPNSLPQCISENEMDYCECTSVIQVPLNAVVQLVLGDETPGADLHHPFHLHGYNFYILKRSQFLKGQNTKSISEDLRNYTNSEMHVLKDTVAVPSNGYAVIRFKADNPGIWFLHCHFMYHHSTGMGILIKVGDNWSSPPKKFPKCGNFMPDINDTFQ